MFNFHIWKWKPKKEINPSQEITVENKKKKTERGKI